MHEILLSLRYADVWYGEESGYALCVKSRQRVRTKRGKKKNWTGTSEKEVLETAVGLEVSEVSEVSEQD